MLRTATRKIGAVYDDALAPLGINIAQYSLLRIIQRRQPVSFTELGRIAELDRSTVGRNVRVLERMGLVETGRGEDDHREAVVTLATGDAIGELVHLPDPGGELPAHRDGFAGKLAVSVVAVRLGVRRSEAYLFIRWQFEIPMHAYFSLF